MFHVKQYKLRGCGNRGYMVTLPREIVENFGLGVGSVVNLLVGDINKEPVILLKSGYLPTTFFRVKQYKLRACGKRGYVITLPREIVEDYEMGVGSVIDIMVGEVEKDGVIIIKKGFLPPAKRKKI